MIVLDNIHQGVNRLKLLALQMNEELDNQKPLTDRLASKIEVLNTSVDKKNKDMKTILLR
jgi:CII-binding regulator of phage lambda lysogenization HflD